MIFYAESGLKRPFVDNAAVEEVIVNPYDKPERFSWLIHVVDKNIDRFDAARMVSYQKATWVLAAATGFVTFSGLAKGESIGKTVKMILQNQTENIETIEYIAAVAALLLVAAYIALFFQIVKVYSIKRVEYPLSLLNPDSGPAVSKYVDVAANQKLSEESWFYALEEYIKPDDLEVKREVLSEYMDKLIELIALNRELNSDLDNTFRILPFLVLFSATVFFIG